MVCICMCAINMQTLTRKNHCGGVLIAVSNEFTCQAIISPDNLEIICINLMLQLPSPIAFCVTYVPPNSTAVYYDSLFSFLLHLYHISDKMIIVGDFNFPDIDWDTLSGHSPASNQFCDLVFQTGLSQLIDQPTHIYSYMVTL